MRVFEGEERIIVSLFSSSGVMDPLICYLISLKQTEESMASFTTNESDAEATDKITEKLLDLQTLFK